MAKPKKSKKKGGSKKGRKSSKAKASSAKRGAKRTTLRAGMIVTKKPNKRTLQNNNLKVKKVGVVNGKPAFKVMKKAARKAPMRGVGPFANAARYDKALLEQKKAEEKEFKKRVTALKRLGERMEKLGVAEEVRKVEAQLASVQADLNAVRAEKEQLQAQVRSSKAQAEPDL